MHKVKFQNYYSILKENLVVITLLPYIFGGICQLYKLACISPDMVRFFSISQVVSDGLIVLVLIIIPLFPTMFLVPVFDSPKIKVFDKESNKYENAVGTVLLFCCMYLSYDYVFNNKLASFYDILKLTVGVSAVISLFVNFLKESNISVFGVKLYIVSSYLIYFIVVTVGYGNISNDYNSIINIKNFKRNLRREYPKVKEIRILYFNDKYIFTKIEKENGSEILISDFNILINK
jgi:hypothetical protein